MRKIASIAFVFIYLSANTEFRQVFKLPILIEHYFEHLRGDKAIGLIDFIALHYFSGDIKDADYSRDQQLPFKSYNCAEASILLALHPENSALPKYGTFPIANVRFAFTAQFESSAYPLCVWQPPRSLC